MTDEAEIKELPDALAAQAVPETTEEPKSCSGRIPTPVTRFENLRERNRQRQLQQQHTKQQSTQTLI